MRLLLLLALSLSLPASAQPVAPPAAPPVASARTLNTEGFRLYQAGQYAEALAKFQAAVQADPKHALAQYNVAATLGLLRKKGEVCGYEAYKSTILQHLTEAVKLDAKRLQRAKEDADLDPIRDTVGWQRLLGRSPTRAADVPEILRKVSWYGPSSGIYGNLSTLRFEEGGKVTLGKKVITDDGPPKLQTFTGTYTVKGRTVEVKLPGQKPDTGSLNAQGVLRMKTLGDFSDAPSECDA